VEHAGGIRRGIDQWLAVLALRPSVANLSLYKAFGVPLKESDGTDVDDDAEAMTAAAGKVSLFFSASAKTPPSSAHATAASTMHREATCWIGRIIGNTSS
jgi:hypothetical protein